MKKTVINKARQAGVTLMTGASGWTTIQAGTSLSPHRPLPVSAENAAADCATGTNMVFTN